MAAAVPRLAGAHLAHARPNRLAPAFLTGWLFGLGYFTVCFYWIGIAFLVDAATYLWMMPFMVGGACRRHGALLGTGGDGGGACAAARVCASSLLAICLAIAEWLRGHLLTGFPWTAPGLAAIGMGGVAQAAPLVGMPGLTLLILLWAGLPALLGERALGAAN